MKFKNTNFQIFVLVVGSILAIIKFLVYFNTGSNSVLSDALESIVNILAGSFTLYSLYLSSLPADQRHPYGHGKIEFIAAGFEGGLLFLAGIFTVYKIVFSYYFGISIQIHKNDVLIIFVLGFINYLLGIWSAYQGEKTNSPAVVVLVAVIVAIYIVEVAAFIA
jgi:cation diffusion facilitator family transporter